MTDGSERGPVKNMIARFAIPAIVAVGTTVTTVVALGQMPASTLTTENAAVEAVAGIEFTSFSEGDVTRTIEEACTMTGCDEASLHPMIKTYASQMDVEQLDAARWAQVRLLTHGMQTMKSANPGSEAAAKAQMELTAAARIAHYYTKQMQAKR